MPEHLAPGVYVEEVLSRPRSIEGVSTATTGFVGPTRYGPTDLVPELITSLAEFERVYGDGRPLEFGDTGPMPNFTWQAVRAYFEEGGRRLYVVRVFRQGDGGGQAHAYLPVNEESRASDPGTVAIRARCPGSGGAMRVRFTVNLGQNIFGRLDGRPTLGAVRPGDIVWISKRVDHAAGRAYLVEGPADAAHNATGFRFSNLAAPAPRVLSLEPGPPPGHLDPETHCIQVVTLDVTAASADPGAAAQSWTDLPLDPRHECYGSRDGLSKRPAANPAARPLERPLPIVLHPGADITSGLALLDAFDRFAAGRILPAVADANSTAEARSIDITLESGNDGNRPTSAEYEGEAQAGAMAMTGLKALEDIDDISIVAAPGSTYLPPAGVGYEGQIAGIISLLVAHAERMRYRIAVVDAANGQSFQDVRKQRATIDSKHAAFYYPWIRIVDPITGRNADMPPSGFVAGIYARNDITRGVHKAPANEVVKLAIGFEQTLSKAQQDVLNPEGINCFRFFAGRGYRLWGARTASSDPEWKYVNLRRYALYLEHSIDKGTRWTVFEPNGDALWASVRRTIEDFLLNEWRRGALIGDKPEMAFFVRCDRSTMTQNDLDNGRLICQIGIAPLRPAEFVIFRIGQWTADRKA
jgi:hypothetical protein